MAACQSRTTYYRSTFDRPPFWPRKFCRRTLVRLFYRGVIIFMVSNRPLFKLNTGMSQHRCVSIKTLKLPPLTLFKIGREKWHPLKTKNITVGLVEGVTLIS